MKKIGLTNNQLKVIAMVAMTLDHIGFAIFPQHEWLRIVGRLAYPIYAYMIAEGCRHTRSMVRYLGSMAILAAICQLVYYFALHSLYMCILVTFSLSIGLIWLLQLAQKNRSLLTVLLLAAGVCAAYFLCNMLPDRLPGFMIDYGFIGVMIPVCIYAVKDKPSQLVILTFCLFSLLMMATSLQWWAFLSIPLLMLYNGRRGKLNMKWFFYLFYPVHLVVIYGIALLMR